VSLFALAEGFDPWILKPLGYEGALRTVVEVTLPGGLMLKAITAPYILGTHQGRSVPRTLKKSLCMRCILSACTMDDQDAAAAQWIPIRSGMSYTLDSLRF
jgi:hypothetical protein